MPARLAHDGLANSEGPATDPQINGTLEYVSGVSALSVNASGETGQRSIDRWQHELAKPLSGGWCLASWFVATAIFVGAVVLLGDPTWSDAVESLYPTWAIAHGSLACSYPPGSAANFSQVYQPVPSVPPLWPLISGGLSALTGIGHAVPFPTQHAFGAGCTNGYTKMYRWALESNVLSATLRLGYFSWVVLLAGFIALLRAVGRGRTRWEAFGAAFLALVPIVWMPILFEFHPQDLVAVGLGLAGTACALRGQWLWAGIFLGLALVSQQFALLILIPVVIVAPGRNRLRVLAAAALSVALVSLPFLVATSGRAIHSVLAGTGDSSTRGGTVLWKLLSHPTPLGGMQTAPLIFISRVAPIVVAVALPLWALRRLGPRGLEPIPLLSLIATSLSMRLVFEQDLYGYKFLALAVLLVSLDIVRGRVRGALLVWISLVTMVFEPIRFDQITTPWWQDRVAIAIVYVPLAVVLCAIIWDAVHHRVRWYLVAWLAIAAGAFIRWPLWLPSGIPAPFPLWFWQVVLVGSGVILAASPLANLMTRTVDQDGQPTSRSDGVKNKSGPDGQEVDSVEH